MNTYIGTVVVTRVDSSVKELGEVTGSQTTVAGSGRRRAALDILEDGLSVWFWDKRCSVVVVPGPLLHGVHVFSLMSSGCF